MPFVNQGITATTRETFDYCLEHLANLNKIIQTINQKDIDVNIQRNFVGRGITLSTTCSLGEIRVCPNNTFEDGFWTDFDLTNKSVTIRTPEHDIYIIYFEPQKRMT